MVSHQPHSQPSAKSRRHAGRKSVPYTDALKLGMWAGIVVLVASSVFMQGSRFAQEGLVAVLSLGKPVLYAGVAFVGFTLVALLLNWVVSRKESPESIDGPVLD